MEPKRYLITSALPYANGPLHIGHIAGAYLPADIYVRYLRLKGKDVKFICGSDEHGVPITLRARNEKTTPQEVVDKYHAIIKKSFEEFGISFDIYHRTSDKLHHKTASAFFEKLYNDGVFTEQESKQFYDESAKMFLADRYIVGTCPNCGNDDAYGDQCEKCGTSLSPRELINPRSQLSGNKPVLKPTKHWYLPLDKMQDEWLQEWVFSHKVDWKNNVFGQCKSWLENGLKPRAVTRDLEWGVPVPIKNVKGKVLYVWFDAPIGYISATRALTDDWKKYWQDKETKLVHFIGKDNIVFHCLIFPAMLKAHGDYILPDNVPANEFLNLEGDKISTSRNWAVWLHEYLEDFKDKQDVLRYVLCSTAPETKDNDFTWKDFQARNNNELVAIFGNFVNRTLVLTEKYFNNQVPKQNALLDEDKALVELLKTVPSKVEERLNKYQFRDALSEAMTLARIGNKYLADNEPWHLIKTDEERVKTILNLCLQLTANLSIIMDPFLPNTSKKVKSLLNISEINWADLGSIDILKEGHKLNKAELLFAKIEDGEIQHQVDKLNKTKEAMNIASATEQRKEATFDDFNKLEIKIGTILEAEPVEKTDKLLKLIVDTGDMKRSIVSGIAKDYKAEEIIGKQVSVLTNLQPKKIRGILSEGMILMAENADGKLAFISPDKEMDKGSTIR